MRLRLIYKGNKARKETSDIDANNKQTNKDNSHSILTR